MPNNGIWHRIADSDLILVHTERSGARPLSSCLSPSPSSRSSNGRDFDLVLWQGQVHKAIPREARCTSWTQIPSWQAMTSHDLQIKMTSRGVMAAWPHLYIYDMSLVVSAPGDWSSSPFSVGSASEVMPPPPPLTIHAVGATKLDSSSGPCTYNTGRHWPRIGHALATHWQCIGSTLATDPKWLSWSHSAKRMNIEKYCKEVRDSKRGSNFNPGSRWEPSRLLDMPMCREDQVHSEGRGKIFPLIQAMLHLTEPPEPLEALPGTWRLET